MATSGWRRACWHTRVGVGVGWQLGRRGLLYAFWPSLRYAFFPRLASCAKWLTGLLPFLLCIVGGSFMYRAARNNPRVTGGMLSKPLSVDVCCCGSSHPT